MRYIEKIELLHNLIKCMVRAYYNINGKVIKTLEELIFLIESDEITMEDVFIDYIDRILKQLTYNHEICWDDNMDMFGVENFFPNMYNKSVGDGSWIKIRNKDGYEIHFAKKSKRKTRYSELIQGCGEKINKLNTCNYASNKIKDVLAKMESLRELQLCYGILLAINIPVYEVVIKRTKSKSEYYTPYQYEIVSDVSEITDYYLSKIDCVNMVSFLDSDNEDKIFYLTSRGISREVAVIMASLNQSYFVVNINKALDKFNKQIKDSLIINLTAR